MGPSRFTLSLLLLFAASCASARRGGNSARGLLGLLGGQPCGGLWAALAQSYCSYWYDHAKHALMTDHGCPRHAGAWLRPPALLPPHLSPPPPPAQCHTIPASRYGWAARYKPQNCCVWWWGIIQTLGPTNCLLLPAPALHPAGSPSRREATVPGAGSGPWGLLRHLGAGVCPPGGWVGGWVAGWLAGWLAGVQLCAPKVGGWLAGEK